MTEAGHSVFINCPFDDDYRSLYRAIIFAIHDCGFIARSAQEADDAGEVRIEKIKRIVKECRFGIHDISRTELDEINHLPRFNMPLELGLFLGARWFGSGRHKEKKLLVLDTQPYRYQKFCSDLSGQDIRAHHGRPEQAIGRVRDWLNGYSDETIPGGDRIFSRFRTFTKQLPLYCEPYYLTPAKLKYRDYVTFLTHWLEANQT